mmetsp:Transcript_20613/g.34027  ORF Transcript_20613/g.34027 Transcript_20613/m.34027 type:complete len:89 (-) Transcript_20613:1018-1284(-)
MIEHKLIYNLAKFFQAFPSDKIDLDTCITTVFSLLQCLPFCKINFQLDFAATQNALWYFQFYSSTPVLSISRTVGTNPPTNADAASHK